MAEKESERRPVFVSRRTKLAVVTAGPVILFTAGGARFAVDANEVQEIRDRDERGAIRKVRDPESIDFARHVGLGAGVQERFLVLKPGECSLGVTEVERMTAQPKLVPLPGLFCGAERQWYRGLLLLDDDVIPLVRTEYWRNIKRLAKKAESSV